MSEFVGVTVAVVDKTISGEAPEVLHQGRSLHMLCSSQGAMHTALVAPFSFSMSAYIHRHLLS